MASAIPPRRLSPRAAKSLRVAGVILALLSLAAAFWRFIDIGMGDARPDHDPLMEPAIWLGAGALALAMLLGFSTRGRLHFVGLAAVAFAIFLGFLVPSALVWSLVSAIPLLLASGCAALLARSRA